MDNEEREFSWTDLFIKVIVILIIILFAVWLLSLANRRMTNSLEVMTNNIFSENINKMKDVGKDYFVAGRLPENVGDMKIITLEEMYKNKMLLTLNDSEGNECSSKNSYVSVEKVDNGYEMKVYLECGEKQDYIITPISCNNCCKIDACNTKSTDNNYKNSTKKLEYQYSKRTGGAWSNWSSYSDWSTKSVTKSDDIDVETKIVKENYTYDKTVNKDEYMGYSTCEVLNGYTLVSNENGVCNYSKIDVITDKPICPDVSGYINVGRIGFSCSYKNETSYKIEEAECLIQEGYYKTGSLCAKNNVIKTTRYASCPDDQMLSNGGCYKRVTTTVTLSENNDVTYYRYRTRNYVGGTIDYKWSTLNNDQNLLKNGYNLTGKTRNVEIFG